MIWKKEVNVCVHCGFVSSEDKWIHEHCPECDTGFLQSSQVTVMVGEGQPQPKLFDEHPLDEFTEEKPCNNTTFVPPVNI